MKRAARDLSNVTIITQMHMHVGTHVDTPLHSIPEGKTVDSYPLSRFMGEGIVLDFRGKGAGKEITAEDFASYREKIRRRDIVMLCTDWSKKRRFSKDYLYRWPYLGKTACNFLTSRKIHAVGTEGMSIAGWSSTGVKAQAPIPNYSANEIHSMLLRRDILIIEGLSNLSDVLRSEKTKRAFFVFAPINFRGSEAAPCRAMAFLDS
jgi:kynurenine formamidase